MQRVRVILGTGGTIAGTAATPGDNIGYTAAQIGAAQLVAAVPALAALALEAEQVAQLDSKDMDHATWQRLAQRLAHHLARDEVQGVVVTHGTDTLEETAYFIHRVLAPAKPVVFTAAMRPATSLQADGPQNLLDAVTLAGHAEARGVLMAMGGVVHRGDGLRKLHSYRLDAFGSGDGGPLGVIEEGVLRRFREWPQGEAMGAEALSVPVADWPRVAVLVSHAGVETTLVRALVDGGIDGIVVAGTGNGTVSAALEAALLEAQADGVAVLRSTRCALGPVLGGHEQLRAATELSPVQARVELMLERLAQRPAAEP